MITKQLLEERLAEYGNIVIIVKNTKISDREFMKNKCYLGWKAELKMWASPIMSARYGITRKNARNVHKNILMYNSKNTKNLDMDLLTYNEFEKLRRKNGWL